MRRESERRKAERVILRGVDQDHVRRFVERAQGGEQGVPLFGIQFSEPPDRARRRQHADARCNRQQHVVQGFFAVDDLREVVAHTRAKAGGDGAPPGVFVEHQHGLALLCETNGEVGDQEALAHAGAARGEGHDMQAPVGEQAAQSGRLVDVGFSHDRLRRRR